MHLQAVTHFNRILNLAVLILVALNSGCASITGIKNHPVSVYAICNGETVAEASCTPMTVKLSQPYPGNDARVSAAKSDQTKPRSHGANSIS